MKLLALLQGKKTYIVLFVIAVVKVFGEMGVIPSTLTDELVQWLVIFGGVTLSAKVNRLTATKVPS